MIPINDEFLRIQALPKSAGEYNEGYLTVTVNNNITFNSLAVEKLNLSVGDQVGFYLKTEPFRLVMKGSTEASEKDLHLFKLTRQNKIAKTLQFKSVLLCRKIRELVGVTGIKSIRLQHLQAGEFIASKSAIGMKKSSGIPTHQATPSIAERVINKVKDMKVSQLEKLECFIKYGL